MKTNIYNIIILDESGSMESIKAQAMNGYNETIQTIKAAQVSKEITRAEAVGLIVWHANASRKNRCKKFFLKMIKVKVTEIDNSSHFKAERQLCGGKRKKSELTISKTN